LAPVITIIGNVFGFIFKVLNYIPGVLPAIITGLTTMYILSKKAAIMKLKGAIAEIWAGNAKFGVIGAALAVGAIAGLMSMMSSASTKVGDMAIESSAAGGGTLISTREGGIFEPSNNDQIAIGPNVLDRLNQTQKLSRVSTTNKNNVGIGGGNIKVLVDELRQLRADMVSGKIRANTFLDGQKVTTGIAIASEQSTRNNFAYGQRII